MDHPMQHHRTVYGDFLLKEGFSAMASAPPAVDNSVSAVTAVWSYVAELIFNLLILVGAVKASDRVVREMMGL